MLLSLCVDCFHSCKKYYSMLLDLHVSIYIDLNKYSIVNSVALKIEEKHATSICNIELDCFPLLQCNWILMPFFLTTIIIKVTLFEAFFIISFYKQLLSSRSLYLKIFFYLFIYHIKF